MNKLLVILGIICLCSCEAEVSKSEQLQELYENVAIEFKYKNHDYIRFTTHSIIHSPECTQCYNKFD